MINKKKKRMRGMVTTVKVVKAVFNLEDGRIKGMLDWHKCAILPFNETS